MTSQPDLPKRSDIIVIGAGIVGLAIARALKRNYPAKSVCVLEKEDRIGAHQTGNNSGVIHSGIYYKPGSMKARLCAEGRQRLYEFAQENGIAHEQCGKVIVATRESELAGLQTLYERAVANGVPGVEIIDADQIREREPHVRALRGIWAPTTGIIDFPAVADAYRRQIEDAGGLVVTGAGVRAIRSIAGTWTLETPRGEIEAAAMVNCGGLFSDRIALMTGVDPGARIVPFRGEYYSLRPERAFLVKGLIYPVPDPAFPFLGVHFTRTIHHGIEAGPNAVLSLKREGYKKTDFDIRDALDTASWPGFRAVARRYWRMGLAETRRSMDRSLFARSLQELVPEVQAGDLLPGGAGVRAQAVTRDGKLVDDFLITAPSGARAVHILNVPSPAATASLAIADYVVENYGEMLA